MIDNNLNARSQVTSNIQGFVNKAQVLYLFTKNAKYRHYNFFDNMTRAKKQTDSICYKWYYDYQQKCNIWL